MESNTNTANPNSPDSSREFGDDFDPMYRSLFPPKYTLPSSLSLTPSTRSTSFSDSDSDDHHRHSTTSHNLNQAQLVLEYQELRDHYDLCNSHLRNLTNELDSLRRENAQLRSANTDLVKLLSSQAAFQSCLLSSSSSSAFQSPMAASFLDDFQRLGFGYLSPHDGVISEESSDISPTSVIERNRLVDTDRISLPKSISVRSSTRPRVPNQLVSRPLTQSEMKVFNQGMLKTELCNKWEETGTCPYGENCQFAHGVRELRPVLRHPRYKTQLCRMVLAGGACPYGHRCHFRHSLTEQEKLQLAISESF
ncbi:zinc finger CCCH domain-containing protein 14 [Pyrus x bretschneideri]|uniref:zinc finger CCCH domain-containing protein 14 n=1 Tax=Pyrus x bretschneideri TaxID=225117 RepID=UPI002030AB23|nr:zinc finger CCCH domain-containing protein 14 [Pyrus x bretschneideri]